MTRLVDALLVLGLEGEVALAGRWVILQGEHCRVYVAEAASGTVFFTWCAEPCERMVEAYRTPTVAIEAGLRRAARRSTETNGAT